MLFRLSYDAFYTLGQHKDSAQRASSIFTKLMGEKLSKAVVGDYITFGAYEQDYNTSNGKEAIEWLVLEKKNNRLLVISRYALDCKRYNESFRNLHLLLANFLLNCYAINIRRR